MVTCLTPYSKRYTSNTFEPQEIEKTITISSKANATTPIIFTREHLD